MTNKIKMFSLPMAGVFITFPAWADMDISKNYLNNLTLPDITWEEAAAAGEDTIIIGFPEKYFHYVYNNTGKEPSARLENNLTAENTGNKLFKEVSGNEFDKGGAVLIDTQDYSGITVKSDFINNSAKIDGGAVYIGNAKVGGINGSFINNSVAPSSSSAHGGAIFNNWSSSVSNISANFINNSAKSSDLSYGGAIANMGNSSIENIGSNFINNHVNASSAALGGAIVNEQNAAIKNITGTFIGNYAQSENSHAKGGAIYNYYNSTIDNIINSDFIGNYVKGDVDSAGGAIWSDSVILITADNGTSLFSGNKANTKSNAIYMSGANLKLSSVNNGVITFDDGIDGINYNIAVSGDGTGEIALNNLVENATALTIDNTTLRLGTNGKVNANNISGNGTIKVDVTFADNNKIQTGVINAADNLTGDYKVIANPVNDGNANYVGSSSVFLTAPNDEATFELARVVGSPYVWDIDKGNTESGYSWSLELTDYEEKNSENPEEPAPSKPVVRPIAPEVIAGAGLHEAAIEQTRSLVRNVRNKVAAGREYCPNCGIYSAEWDGKQLRNVWVLAQGETATIDKPVKMDADIWGAEAGFDVQNDVNNTLGVFASYRKGEYDLSGKADKLHSNVGSEIDIDSYLAGLYYRYDKNMNWLFATVYGGVQQADAKTDDKIAKFDTDGIEFGASIEAGHTFALSNDLTLDPSLGLYYTQVNFDDAKDNVGKEYNWKDVKHLEAELGAKLEKQIDYAKIYVKPSVIQTVTSGDSVKITGLNKLSTYDDQTLGRIELGGRYGFTDALSAYGWVNYTFGSDYDATAFGAGLNYAW